MAAFSERNGTNSEINNVQRLLDIIPKERINDLCPRNLSALDYTLINGNFNEAIALLKATLNPSNTDDPTSDWLAKTNQTQEKLQVLGIPRESILAKTMAIEEFKEKVIPGLRDILFDKPRLENRKAVCDIAKTMAMLKETNVYKHNLFRSHPLPKDVLAQIAADTRDTKYYLQHEAHAEASTAIEKVEEEMKAGLG